MSELYDPKQRLKLIRGMNTGVETHLNSNTKFLLAQIDVRDAEISQLTLELTTTYLWDACNDAKEKAARLAIKLAIAREVLRAFASNHKCNAEDGRSCSTCGRSEWEVSAAERVNRVLADNADDAQAIWEVLGTARQLYLEQYPSGPGNENFYMAHGCLGAALRKAGWIK